MNQKAHIDLKGGWESGGYNFAISNSGKHIAVRHVNQESYASSPPNIFVYDTRGREVFSFLSSHGGEQGVAFWPDNNYVITSGCGHPQNWEADGIKQWLIGDKNFNYLFANTHLTGTWVDLLGVTPKGRYILGVKAECWIIDTHNNREILLAQQIDARLDWLVFSENEKFTGVAKNIFIKIGNNGGLLLDNSSGEILWQEQNEFVLAFHPNNGAFLTVNFDKLIFRKLPDTTKIDEYSLARLGKITHTVTAAAYSQDGSKLAVGPIDKRYVLVFDVESMELLEKIPLIIDGSCRIRLMRFSLRDELIIVEFDHSQSHITIWE